jgi:hypothetical protein
LTYGRAINFAALRADATQAGPESKCLDRANADFTVIAVDLI